MFLVAKRAKNYDGSVRNGPGTRDINFPEHLRELFKRMTRWITIRPYGSGRFILSPFSVTEIEDRIA